MKMIVLAGMLSAALIGTAQAAPTIPLDAGLAASDGATTTPVAWIGRYGQPCFHGPVWIPACHATDRPVGYMVGHWNAIGTRYIPGRYY